MEESKEKTVSMEKLKVGLLAAILAVLLIFTAAVGVLLFQVKTYADTAGEVINRLNQVSAALDDLDTARMVATANQVTAALEEAKIDQVVESLTQVSSQLALVDWETMGANINDLAVQAQESLVIAEEALAKAGKTIDEMDIEALNQAIRDLQAAIEPMAKFAKLFK
jgi:predicted PurR-regulated permease PerM